MREQLRRAATPGPNVIGLDQVSIRKGQHTYRIVVSDLIPRRPIWFGGADRFRLALRRFSSRLAQSCPAPTPVDRRHVSGARD